MSSKNQHSKLSHILSFIAWVTAVLVSLAVGFSMTSGGALYNAVPFIPASVVGAAGWIVIILTLISAVLAIIEQLR